MDRFVAKLRSRQALSEEDEALLGRRLGAIAGLRAIK